METSQQFMQKASVREPILWKISQMGVMERWTGNSGFKVWLVKLLLLFPKRNESESELRQELLLLNYNFLLAATVEEETVTLQYNHFWSYADVFQNKCYLTTNCIADEFLLHTNK